MADLENKEKITKQEIEELKQQAQEFLTSRYFYAASDLFKRILENNPNDKDGHIGLLLTSNKIGNEERLIEYYQDLFSDEEYEIKLAAEKEENHIEEMCDRYFIPGYYEKEEISRAYDFDLSYKSDVFFRKKQKEEIIRTIDSDEHLKWLKQKGFKEIPDILKAYDQRIEKAEESDRENIRRIKGEYQRFLYKAYSDVKESYQKAKERREKDYRDLIKDYEDCSDIDRLKEISLCFEKLDGYKEASDYAVLCDDKIERVRSELKDKNFKRIVDDSLAEAKAALIVGRFSDAYEGFTKVTSMDPENEEAYLGILMARSETPDEDELFEYYKNLYDEDSIKILEACEEDSGHIKEMADKYHLPDFLDKETIYEKYRYDRTYRSSLDSRIEQENRFKEEVETDPVFMWLKDNGSEHTRKRIKELYGHYSLRVKEAREEDKKNVEQIRNNYQRFLFKTYSSVKDSYKKATAKKEESYRQLIREFELAGNAAEFKDLISGFEELGEYKECGKYIGLCYEKIRELKEKENADYLDQEIETSLIAGRTYLSSDNKELADESFGRVLTLDPGNPRAYLGILMLETGTKNIDELVDYYANLYTEDEGKITEACAEDKEHIRAMAEKYSIPGYLEKGTIEKYYSFDRSFESFAASRERQRDQFNEEVRMNPLLAKVAAGKDTEIVSFLRRVRDSYEQRVVEAKEQDKKQIDSLRHVYEVYLEESDKAVLAIYEEKIRQKNEDAEAVYLKNVEEFGKDLSEEELEKLCDKFDLNYKDGPVFVKKCKDRIRELRKAREAERLALLLENGTALLESELFEEAEKRFASYLEIDSENEEVHLKLLMAEKKVMNVTDLFDHYKVLYSDEIPETREAVEENKDHIEDIADKCCIAGEFEKEDIRKRYVFDRTYGSLLNARLVQRQQIEDEISIDPELAWLYKNGSDKVQGYFEDLLDVYDQRIQDAKEEDEHIADAIRKQYRAFVRNTDREVRSFYNELNKGLNRRLKDRERSRKEEQRKRKEEEKRQSLLREEEQKKKLLTEEAEREEALRRKAEEEAEKQRRAEALEKEKSEKQREELARAEKERQSLLKAQEAELRKEEQRKKKAARTEARKLNLPRKIFKQNFALIAAALSLGILTFVIYAYVIEPRNKYNDALTLAENGQFDEAIALFSELGSYKDAEYRTKETTYFKAEDLYRNGETVEAANIFNKLRFDDSGDRAEQIKKEMIGNADVNDVILFGEYEQDGNTDNGKELIEWIVLDKQEGSILVLSKYSIDAQYYNSSDEAYWENSSLRSWLNGRFADNAFAGENPSDVLSSTLVNLRFPDYDQETDFDELLPEEYETRDRVFLLSNSELEQYIPEEADRICYASEYAIENGVAANADNTCSWWLRGPSLETLGMLQIVNKDGGISNSMYEITNAVRPAMWIKMEQ